MPGFNVNRFRSDGLTLQGARPCLFTITLTFPVAVQVPGLGNKLQLTARAASLPSSVIDPIDVPYFGRKIKVFGNRNFEDWEITIMNDNDFLVRNAFEAWHNLINTIVSNRLDPAVSDVNPALGNSYKSIGLVTQFDPIGPGDIDGEGAIKSYMFDGLWPVAVSDIPLDWDAQNQIEQFSVRFAYDWYEPRVKASDPPIFPVELQEGF